MFYTRRLLLHPGLWKKTKKGLSKAAFPSRMISRADNWDISSIIFRPTPGRGLPSLPFPRIQLHPSISLDMHTSRISPWQETRDMHFWDLYATSCLSVRKIKPDRHPASKGAFPSWLTMQLISACLYSQDSQCCTLQTLPLPQSILI